MNSNKKEYSTCDMNTSKYVNATLLCVQLPFSLVMNAYNLMDILNCSQETHSLTTC